MAGVAGWVQVGFTYYNDPPPGAGNLRWGGYSFAELGTATRAGQLTGRGNLGQAFGITGEEAMGSSWSLLYGSRVVHARKEDRGYGQGGDGDRSDPRYAIDLYDGSRYGLPNLRAALGAPPSGALWIRRGTWRPPELTPTSAAHLGPEGALVSGGTPPQAAGGTSASRHDYSRKVQTTGKGAGEHGTSLQNINRALSGIPARLRRF